MTARRRALVQRPGRKAHLATLGAGESAWISVCDREIPVFGATLLGEDWAAWLAAAEHDDGVLCVRCRTPLLVAALALAEVEQLRASNLDREALLAEKRSLEVEIRSLRAQVADWCSAFANEAKKIQRRRDARREERFDARLAEQERKAAR